MKKAAAVASSLRDAAQEYLRTALSDPVAAFRDGQWESIENLVQHRKRLLIVQRTGWGKSVVYFIATRILRDRGAGPTLLVSPLLALMRNQIEAATRLGIRAETMNSTNQDEWKSIEGALLADEVDVLLVSPERLANQDFEKKVLSQIADRVGMLVVDEAHCISDWGHDFRPDYRRIVRIVNSIPPNVPILGTTATANNRVVDDVVEQIGRVETVRGPLARASLRLQTINLPSRLDRMAWLAAHLPSLPGSGIVYTRTVPDANMLAEWLRSEGIDAHAYYGGLDNDNRVDLEGRLLANDVKALVATSALGMGFDKPDLGFVVHYQRPGSVVEYYQQVGRAGRAIQEAYGVLLSGEEDDRITHFFIRQAFPPQAHMHTILDELDAAENGLKKRALESAVNLRSSDIEKALKILATLNPAPVVKQGQRWVRTANPYVHDQGRIDGLVALRKQEQEELREYAEGQTCHMEFLRHALDEKDAQGCGTCAVCRGGPVVAVSVPQEVRERAATFVGAQVHIIKPRKQVPQGAPKIAFGQSKARIPEALRFEEGRALARWGDPRFGKLIQHGKFKHEHFDDELVEAMGDMILHRWNPQPRPTWVTCVPSRTRPDLVPSFAQRLADRLDLPFHSSVERLEEGAPQKEMENSFQQYANVRSAFRVVEPFPVGDPVLLVDDMVDSRWTFTWIAGQLRARGSGRVFPVALANTTAGD